MASALLLCRRLIPDGIAMHVRRTHCPGIASALAAMQDEMKPNGMNTSRSPFPPFPTRHARDLSIANGFQCTLLYSLLFLRPCPLPTRQVKRHAAPRAVSAGFALKRESLSGVPREIYQAMLQVSARGALLRKGVV